MRLDDCEGVNAPVADWLCDREGFPVTLGLGDCEEDAEPLCVATWLLEALPDKLELADGDSLGEDDADGLRDCARVAESEAVAESDWLGLSVALRDADSDGDSDGLGVPLPLAVQEPDVVKGGLGVAERLALDVALGVADSDGLSDWLADPDGEGTASAAVADCGWLDVVERLGEYDSLADALWLPEPLELNERGGGVADSLAVADRLGVLESDPPVNFVWVGETCCVCVWEADAAWLWVWLCVAVRDREGVWACVGECVSLGLWV